MNAVKWWQWLCVGLLATACSLATTGCDDDDDDEDVSDAPTVVVVTNTVHETTVVVTNPPAADPEPAVTTRVLLDRTLDVDGEDGFGVLTEATPAAGTVTVEASWTCIDLITGGGASIDIPLEFKVNEGVAGAGSFHNAGHPSPFTGAVGMPAGVACSIQVYNNTSDSLATVHLKATWTAN